LVVMDVGGDAFSGYATLVYMRQSPSSWSRILGTQA